MDLKNDIKKQLNAGFSKEEIYMNLQEKGATVQEIDRHFSSASNDPEVSQRYGSVSIGSILIGILCLVVMLVRLWRYQDGGNGFLLIGVFTAFILALLFFTRRK